jgi:uncharacterized protein (DUF58 family)
MLVATLLVLLVASINYQLNLGYLLTFLLAGSAVVGMHVCHATLRGLTMNAVAARAAVRRQQRAAAVVLSNERKTTRYGIGLAVLDASHDDRWAWTDVPGQGTSTVRSPSSPLRRGLHRVPPLTAETRFPLGTFRVWTVWRPAAQVLVYPRPSRIRRRCRRASRAPAAPAPRACRASASSRACAAYRRGDPLKLVVWKKAAKTDELVSRDTQQAQRTELWLEFAKAGAATPRRASRGWRVGAAGRQAGPGLRPAPARQGDPARRRRGAPRRCLEALALC